MSEPRELNELNDHAPSAARDEGMLGLRLIGALKLASGLALAAAGLGIFRLLDRDMGATVEHFVSRLHLDPDSRLIHEPLVLIAGLDRNRLRALGLGTLFYAGLHLVEGAGLVAKRRWAEYLTVIASASLLPLEIYEIIRKVVPLRILVLAVNVAIVIYLIAKLRHDRRRRQ